MKLSLKADLSALCRWEATIHTFNLSRKKMDVKMMMIKIIEGK